MEPTHFEALYPANSRFDVIASLFKFIKEGNSCELIGLPGVGRANIFGLLAYNHAVREAHVGENQKWFHFIPVDFSEVRNKPLFDVTKLMFLELVESLHERKLLSEYEEISNIFKESLTFGDELVLSQGLKKAIEYLAIEKELTVVFLFERFEEYLPMLTQDFFSNLRILRNRAKYRFSAVFSVGRPLEDNLDPLMLSDFYEFLAGHHVFVPLEDTPVADFRLKYLEKVTGGNIPPKIQKEVETLTGHHGKLTRLCFEAFLSTKEEITTQLFLSKKPILGALQEIWHYLSPQEQQIAQEFAFSKTPISNGFLENVGLVKQEKIAIPLFTEFIKTTPSITKQDLTFDPLTNTIKKGSTTLSDTLTASEFRLLSYLLQHPDEVVSRDDIIQTVWKDAASTAGVTDQAVDQLVFRLRKKIEANPNNPLFIQTIKGRGIKYSPLP